MDSVITYRRYLHRIPELDNDLPKTTAFVQSKLEPLRCQISNPICGSVCAFFDAGKPETCLLYTSSAWISERRRGLTCCFFYPLQPRRWYFTGKTVF